MLSCMLRLCSSIHSSTSAAVSSPLHGTGLKRGAGVSFALLPALLSRLSCMVDPGCLRSEEHTSELQSHRDLHSFPTRRSSDLQPAPRHRLEARRRCLIRTLARTTI